MHAHTLHDQTACDYAQDALMKMGKEVEQLSSQSSTLISLFIEY